MQPESSAAVTAASPNSDGVLVDLDVEAFLLALLFDHALIAATR
ncbi:hypothetical protein [Pseudomonas glycinae]